MSQIDSFMPASVAPNNIVVTACYSISAIADPGIMPRVAAIFAKRGLMPMYWEARVTGEQDEDLAIDLHMAGLPVIKAEQIAQTLRQIVGVDRVLMSTKPQSTADSAAN